MGYRQQWSVSACGKITMTGCTKNGAATTANGDVCKATDTLRTARSTSTGSGGGDDDPHHLVVIVEFEAELPLLCLRPPQLGVRPQRHLRELLFLVLDESF